MSWTLEQKIAISKLFEQFQKTVPTVIPDFECGSNGSYIMTNRTLQDYAERCFKSTLEDISKIDTPLPPPEDLIGG